MTNGYDGIGATSRAPTLPLLLRAEARAGAPWIRGALVHVSPAGPLTLGLSTAMLLVAAGLGYWIPARRATKVDPLVALRWE